MLRNQLNKLVSNSAIEHTVKMLDLGFHEPLAPYAFAFRESAAARLTKQSPYSESFFRLMADTLLDGYRP